MSRAVHRSFACAAVLGLALVPAEGRAAGFAIFEAGARGMGFAGAYTAQASDPSAIFHNAAGLAFLKGKQLYLGGTLISPGSTFTGADPYPGQGRTEKMNVGSIPVPSIYYSHQFSERMVLGLGVHTPFGLKTQWQNPDTFSGRFISTLADLKSFSINPTLAWKGADRLGLGVGLDVRLSKVQFDRRVPAPVNPFTQKVVDIAAVQLTSGWKTSLGFNLGVLAKPTESLSLGAAYRHKVKADYSGSASFSAVPTGNAQLDARVAASLPGVPQAVKTAIEFPAIASAGAAYSFGDWTVEADVDWYQWSTFGSIFLDFDNNALDDVIAENYKDSFQVRVGAERRLTDHWTLRGGYYFDQSPAPTESVSPLLPDANRHGLCAGASWQRGAWRVDGAAWYLLWQKRSTEGINRDHFDGSYDSKTFIVGLSLGYSF